MTSLPNEHEPDDQLVVRYLVGSLAEDEIERLDELSIADDRFAEHLRAVENDLVDAYVRGDLSGDTLEGFKTHYLASPAAQDKVTFAEALLNYQRSAARAPELAPGRQGSGVARLVPQWGWAVAAMLCLGVTGYLLLDNNRLRHEMADASRARAALEAHEQQLQRQVDQQRSTGAEAAKELTQARDALGQRQGPVEASQQSARPVMASFVLLPPTRGAGDLPSIAIPPGTQKLTLQVDLESDDFPTYRAELKDSATAQAVWRGANLRAAARDGARSLAITLDATVLAARTYTVDVIGVPARGVPAPVGSYPFRVLAK
jgi:hypothetical protein